MQERGSWARGGLWPWILAAIGVFLTFLTVVLIHRLDMREISSHGTLRIGMQESPPWYFFRPDKVIDGPVYEIVQEAARRRKLDIVWVSDAVGPDHALGNGLADLWPLMGRLPHRLDKYNVSESWLDLSYVLCSPIVCGSHDSREAAPQSIAHRGTEVTRSVLDRKFPAVRQIVVSSHIEALTAVCSGRAGAALITESAQPAGLLNVPPPCRESNVCLRISPLATIGFGVGSRPGSREARAASILLRAEIDRMIDDGTLSGILLKWGVSSGEVRALRSASLAHTRERVMSGIAAVLVCALLGLWIVYRRLLAAKRHGERVQADLRESQAALQTEFERRSDIEARYHQSQKLESLGRLAGGVAHDFNNLLSVINGFSEILMARTPQDGSLRHAIEEISKAGARGADLTRQLLIYSRHQDVALLPINLNDVVNDMTSLLRSMAGTNVSINVQLDDSLGLVMCDRGQMDRILMNLVVNARDAMPEGGAITIKTVNANVDGDDHPPGFVLLTVSDTGVGMDSGTRSRIFEPFFTTNRTELGTGMGLPIVQSVVHSVGGWVDVESTVGKGSSFRVFLPHITGQNPPATIQSV
jgi:signal transduction histidine kinase